MSGMSRRVPRPTELVALVSFDGELRENQAVTRERLAHPQPPPRPLSAAVERWLGLRRLTWFEMDGRQIAGIATAQALGTRDASQIDTLIDARPLEHARDAQVPERLLQQVAESAAAARVGHVLLRTPADGPAVQGALRAGFAHALAERLWAGELRTPAGWDPQSLLVREVEATDAPELFRLYNRALPVDARRALAMTQEEWSALDERRWLGRRGRRWLAEAGGRVVAALHVSGQGATGQIELLCEPGGTSTGNAEVPARADLGRDGGAALLARAAEATARCEQVIALVPSAAGVVEGLLREHGLAPGRELRLLALRTRRLVSEPVRQRAGIAVPTGS
jgi:hypothetical protein